MTNIHIKTAWDHVRRAPFQALSAISALTITFFVITILSITIYSSNQIIKYFETRPQIIAFLKDEITPEQVTSLQTNLENDPRVKKVNYVSKEQALEIYKKATSDNPLLSELVSPSIFPASLEIQVNELSYANDLINEIKQNEIVDQVGFTASLGNSESLTNVLQRLRNITTYLRLGGGVFSLMLVLTSFFVLIVIIGMKLTMRRGEIEILELIGATQSFIRKPIILEAVIYALAGVFFGWMLGFVLVLYTTPSLVAYFGEIPILPKNTLELTKIFGIILSGELLLGLILAVLGSILALSRVRRK